MMEFAFLNKRTLLPVAIREDPGNLQYVIFMEQVSRIVSAMEPHIKAVALFQLLNVFYVKMGNNPFLLS
jgi:hypothetical protein